MIAEPFASGTSFLHRTDPRAKITAVTALSVVVAVSPTLAAPVLALAAGVILAAWAGLPLGPVLRRLGSVNLFIGFLWLFLPFSTPGDAVWSLGPLTATAQGLRLALLITLKSNAIMLIFLALAATSDAAALGQGMDRLGVPPKLVFLFLFTYRFIHVFAEEYARLSVAARLRGFRPRSDAHTYRTLASLLAMVLLGAMRRAEMARRAMLLRCFTGRFATLRVFHLDRGGKFFLAGMAVLTLVLATLELMHV